MGIIKPNADLIKKLDFKHPATWLATWFGFGLMSPAPGTWGTFGALPLGLVLLAAGKVPLAIGLLAVVALGLWSARKFQEMTGEHDSPVIVIDEVAGIFIALLACPLSPAFVALAVVLFRFFDILKPWPISWLDKNCKGAFGVMIDDIAAGLATAALIYGMDYALTAGRSISAIG